MTQKNPSFLCLLLSFLILFIETNHPIKKVFSPQISQEITKKESEKRKNCVETSGGGIGRRSWSGVESSTGKRRPKARRYQRVGRGVLRSERRRGREGVGGCNRWIGRSMSVVGICPTCGIFWPRMLDRIAFPMHLPSPAAHSPNQHHIKKKKKNEHRKIFRYKTARF